VTEAQGAILIGAVIGLGFAVLGVMVAMTMALIDTIKEKKEKEATTLHQVKDSDGWETIATWIEDPDGTRHSATPERVAEFKEKWKAREEVETGETG
jgi:hypothetical protein